ncbi:MAG: hypothetical protein RL007_545 [Bacteroidota bacterium]
MAGNCIYECTIPNQKLFLILTFLTFAEILIARNEYQSTVDLNVRSEPSANSPSIAVVKKGDHLTVLDSTSSFWYKVAYNGDTGYAAKKYLTHLEETPATNRTAPKNVKKTDKLNVDGIKIGILVCSGIALLIFTWAASRIGKSKKKLGQATPASHTNSVPAPQSALENNSIVGSSNGKLVNETFPVKPNQHSPYTLSPESKSRSVKTEASEENTEVPVPKIKVTITVNSKPFTQKDDSIIDITGKAGIIPEVVITGLKKYEPGVPYWSHQYIYSVNELTRASKEQRTFYQEFRSAFLGGTYYDVEGNSNYPFTLMFDLEQESQNSNNVEWLNKQYDLLKKYYPKTGNYTLDILIKNYQRVQATEKAAELQSQKPTYSNSSYDFHADYWGLGTRYKSKLNLTEDQAKRLNKLIDTSNNFNSIEYVAHNLIRSFFASVEMLEKHFISCGTTFEAEVNQIAALEISKHYKFRKGSANYKELMSRFPSTIDQVIYKTGENIFREHFFIGRKTEMTWYVKSSEALEIFHAKFGDTINRSVSEYLKTAEAPNDKTEIEFNQYSKARWKNKLEGIKLGNLNHQKFYDEVCELGIQNAKNPAVENIFFESSKHIAKSDKITALKLYVHYVDHDLRSVTFDNKQLTKTIQKSLFQTTEQSVEFERILMELIKDKDINKALTAVETIYQPKRRKISLDRNKIKEVQEQHSETVELLNEYLQDTDDGISATTFYEPVSKPEIVHTSSLFRADLQLNEMQVTTLVMLCKNGFSVSVSDLDQFAKSNGAFRGSLIDGINDKCYDALDDVLIEDNGDTYTINESYYTKLLIQ